MVGLPSIMRGVPCGRPIHNMNKKLALVFALLAAVSVIASSGCGFDNMKGESGPAHGNGVGPEPEEQGPKGIGDDNGHVSTGTTGSPQSATTGA